MNLTKQNRNQSNLLSDFQNQVNSLFKDFWSHNDDQLRSSHFAPNIEVTEDKKKINVKADLPGMEEKDIDVQLKNNILTIKGERKEESEKEIENCHYKEVSYGSFQRSISLPDSINMDKINASYKKGVLHIEIPKDETKAPKQIQVKVN